MSEEKKSTEKPERPPEFKTEPVRRNDPSREFSHSDDKPSRRGNDDRRER